MPGFEGCNAMAAHEFCIPKEGLRGQVDVRAHQYLKDSLDLMPGFRCLQVPGDGNCLPHSVSRAILGTELLYHSLRWEVRDEILNNMDWYRAHWNNTYFMDEETGNEDLTSAAQESVPPENPDLGNFGMAVYTGPVHLFAMANVVQRPIVLFGDSSRPAEQSMSGVYLPLRTGARNPPLSPLFVAWANSSMNHFCAIAPTCEGGVLEEPIVVDRAALPRKQIRKVEAAGDTEDEEVIGQGRGRQRVGKDRARQSSPSLHEDACPQHMR